MDDDVRRFIAFVKKESDKEEDFVMDRVRGTTIYKLLETKYSNMDEICELALRKSTLYERMRDILTRERKTMVNVISCFDPSDAQATNIVYRAGMISSWDPGGHLAYERFMWRYGADEALKLATEVVLKYPADGSLHGKFSGEIYERGRR
jgi:hypothetical protein